MAELYNTPSGIGEQPQQDAPAAAPAPEPGSCPPGGGAPAVQPRIRRVGTLTMGLALILTGCAIAASLLWPSFDLTIVFRLCPLVLISLGCEVLASSFARGNVRLKYDLVSMFFCSVLIVLALCLSMVPLAVRYFGPEYRLSGQKIENELDRTAYGLLRDDTAVADCQADVYLSRLAAAPASSAGELTDADEVHLSVELRGPYADSAAFAADCARVRDALLSGIAEPDTLSFHCVSPAEEAAAGSAGDGGAEEMVFSLCLSGPFQLNQSAEELAQTVEIY